MKYGELNLGQIEAIVNKLGGMDGVQRFLSGNLIVKPTECKWQVWKTIKLGTGPKTADAFRVAIKDKKMRISDCANDILGKPEFRVATAETEIDLVAVFVKELGFKNGAKREDIYARTKKFGLELCPNEVGPQLRLQYADQPNKEWLVVGMEPITDSDGDLELFNVRRNDSDLSLHSYYVKPDRVWSADDRVVFVLSRK